MDKFSVKDILANRQKRAKLGLTVGVGIGVVLFSLGYVKPAPGFTEVAELAKKVETIKPPVLLPNLQENESEIPMVTVYTPTEFIPAGTRISRINFDKIQWVEEIAPTNAVQRVEAVLDMYTTSDLTPGVPLVSDILSPEVIVASLPVKAGHRAVSLNVDPVSGLEGHARAGSKVDVIMTTVNTRGQLKTSMLAQNVTVLSYGFDSRRFNHTDVIRRKPRLGKTITLGLSPEESLKLSAAKEVSKISLLLRAKEEQLAGSLEDEFDEEIEVNAVNLLIDENAEAEEKKERIRFCPSYPGSRLKIGTPSVSPKYARNLERLRKMEVPAGIAMVPPLGAHPDTLANPCAL